MGTAIDMQTILIIRHAEKPEPGGDDGVDGSGTSDSKSLAPRGWQRSGAWAELFAPSLRQQPAVPKPTALFASAPASHSEIAAGKSGSKSRRPLETISPLAAKLDIEIDVRFGKGRETDLAAAISTIEGVVLVCWQHEDIFAIAKALAPNEARIPAHWPGDCFNVMFRFDRENSSSPWVFQQVVPVILEGDRAGQL
jgi:hypothetical protein